MIPEKTTDSTLSIPSVFPCFPLLSALSQNTRLFFITTGEGKQFHIAKKIWTILDALPRKELYDQLSQIIRRERIRFPVLSLEEEFAVQEFLRLKQKINAGEDFLLDTSDSIEPRYCPDPNKDYDPLNAFRNPFFDVIIARIAPLLGAIVSNLCQYSIRTQGSCHPLPTPIEIWTETRKETDGIRAKMMQRLHHVVNNHLTPSSDVTESDMASTIGMSHIIPAQFPPYVVPAIIKFLRNYAQTPDDIKWKVLDPCAGWSDRLVGALASETMVSHYVGIDPNRALIPGQEKAIRLCPSTVVAYHIPRCAEDVVDEDFGPFRDLEFDISLTSPPFFFKEHYGDSSTQSTRKHCDENQSLEENLHCWLDNFLFPMLERVWNRLKPGGFLVIHIDDFRPKKENPLTFYPICDPMNNFIGRKLEGKYLGVIGLAMSPPPSQHWGVVCDPIWVWQKPSKKGVNNHEC